MAAETNHTSSIHGPELTATERAYLTAARRGDLDQAARLLETVDADQAATENRLNGPGALRATALWYATNLGLPVFPCIPGGKRPATAHGFKDATVDTVQIDAWWRTDPVYNVAAPTGLLFDVIDVDGPEGVIALGYAVDTDGWPGGRNPIGWAHTPHGMHRFIPPTGLGNTAGMFPSVDYRGAGGYVVLPPSRTPDGVYRWYEPLAVP